MQRALAQIAPDTSDILRSIESNRFVTGVTWVDGELQHGAWQDARSDLRRIDPDSGNVIELVEMPEGTGVLELESDGAERFSVAAAVAASCAPYASGPGRLTICRCA